MNLIGMITNAISRKFEYKADEFASSQGYGDSLITGLKKLSRNNYSNLNPHPVIVTLEYSHPPLSQRVSTIKKNK
jgi:STE24 endopeptidase